MVESLRRNLLITVLLVGLGWTPSQALAQIGITAGYGVHLLGSPSFSSTAQNSLSSPGGFNLGLFYDFRFGSVTLRPGMAIRQASFDWESSSWKPEENPISSSFRVAEVPIDLLYHFRMPSMSPYLVVGPSFNFIHTDQQDLRISFDNPKGTTQYMGFTLGAGIELRTMGLILLPELRYSHALSGFMKEQYIVRAVPFASDAQSINTLTFRLGVSLPSFE